MIKIDLKKELKHLYNPPTDKVAIVDVPKMNYLMVDGKGDPNTSPDSQEAVEALYTVAYTLKFTVKKGAAAIDYGVMPLEGLWWTDDMTKFSQNNKSIWKFTYMIMQPQYITKDMVEDAIKQVAKKKKLPALSRMRFETFSEGSAAQIMHIGPFSEEKPAIDKLHQFIAAKGYTFDGLLEKHHEIYLSDIRKAAPEKWRTIVRQPFHEK